MILCSSLCLVENFPTLFRITRYSRLAHLVQIYYVCKISPLSDLLRTQDQPTLFHQQARAVGQCLLVLTNGCNRNHLASWVELSYSSRAHRRKHVCPTCVDETEFLPLILLSPPLNSMYLTINKLLATVNLGHKMIFDQKISGHIIHILNSNRRSDRCSPEVYLQNLLNAIRRNMNL